MSFASFIFLNNDVTNTYCTEGSNFKYNNPLTLVKMMLLHNLISTGKSHQTFRDPNEFILFFYYDACPLENRTSVVVDSISSPCLHSTKSCFNIYPLCLSSATSESNDFSMKFRDDLVTAFEEELTPQMSPEQFVKTKCSGLSI